MHGYILLFFIEIYFAPLYQRLFWNIWLQNLSKKLFIPNVNISQRRADGLLSFLHGIILPKPEYFSNS